jgi:hypothetical protein
MFIELTLALVLVVVLFAIYRFLIVTSSTESQLAVFTKTTTTNYPVMIPQGTYKKHYYSADTFALWEFILVTILWQGCTFTPKDNDTGICNMNLLIPCSKETGDVSLAMSQRDNKPCVRVDFVDRYYEMRPIEMTGYEVNRYINVVTSKTSGKILDINTLTLT